MLAKVSTIAVNTARELIRSKILYAVVFFALLVLGASSLFGTVTIGNKVKVLKDFGLFSLSIFSVLFITVTGSSLLSKELDRKTIFNILSKPVSRSAFIFGKYLGIALTTIILVALMSVLLISFLYLYEQAFDFNLLIGIYGIMLQALIVSALIIFFSSILVTPILSGGLTFCCFIIGRSSDFIFSLAEKFRLTGFTDTLLQIVHKIIPQLDKLDYSNQVVYAQPVLADTLVFSSLYALAYSLTAVLIAGFMFKRREFN